MPSSGDLKILATTLRHVTGAITRSWVVCLFLDDEHFYSHGKSHSSIEHVAKDSVQTMFSNGTIVQ